MKYSKYKDASPEETIKTIKKIYDEKLVLKLKLNVSKRIDGIFSATLTDIDAGWNTCGKGTSDLFCAASAYGESVEHLCNYFAYEITNLSKEANEAFGFEKYPDEVKKDLTYIYTEMPDMLLDLRMAYGLVRNKMIPDEKIIELWKKFLHRDIVPFVPYYSIKTRKYKMVPENMIFYLCGSNGGAAGNTPEEAIGHACDEIIERYVKHKIYMESLTPPEVPREYISKRCPELIEVINTLEKNKGYKIIVKDASLGLGFSVMSVLMINQKKAEYLVNFGAHPKFEIALERCLTEMLQAFIPEKHNYRKNMEKWSDEIQKRAKYPQNWVTILKDDSGAVPDTFFLGSPSWKFQAWPQYPEYSNRMGMEIQLKKLLEIAPDVYIHDVSYLGFPAYRVYAPTVSTSYIPFDEFQLKCYETIELFVKMAEKGEYSIDNIQKLEKTLFNEKTFINGLIFRSLGEGRFHLLHAAVCCDIREFELSKKYLRLSRTQYSECLIRTVELMEKGISKDNMKYLLKLFFEEEIAKLSFEWIDRKAFEGTMKLFESMGVSFSQRMFMQKKNIDAINKLHVQLKKTMLEQNRGEAIDRFFAKIKI